MARIKWRVQASKKRTSWVAWQVGRMKQTVRAFAKFKDAALYAWVQCGVSRYFEGTHKGGGFNRCS